MAELRRRGLPERFESWVQTARATPRLEAGSPLAGMWNDAVSSIPLPSDVAGLGHLAGALAGEGMNPQGNFPGMAAGLARGLPAGILNQIDQHPFAAIAALAGPPHALDLYREAMPLSARMYLHQFYGGGRPLTKLPRRIEHALQESGNFNESGYADKSHLLDYLEKHRPDVKVPVEHGSEYGMLSGSPEAYSGLGRFFRMGGDPEKAQRIWDWYEFFPELYGDASYLSAISKGTPFSKLENIARNKGKIAGAAEAVKSAAKEGIRMVKEEGISGAKSGTQFPFEPQLAWLANHFGTPYPVDVRIPAKKLGPRR